MEFDASELTHLALDLEREAGRVGAETAATFRKTGADIQRDARALAPLGETGDLRRSITTSVVGDGRFGAIAVEVGPTVDYAHFVEDGTSRQAPQPFMAPAAAKHVPTLITKVDGIAGSIL